MKIKIESDNFQFLGLENLKLFWYVMADKT